MTCNWIILTLKWIQELAFYAHKDDVSKFGNVITACRGTFSTKFTFISSSACIDNLIFNEKL